MTDQSVFNKEATEGQPAQDQPVPTNPFADQLAGIKKEDGTQKYDSIDKALEALQHSQAYIPELQGSIETKDQEINRLKAELEQRQSVEEVVSRLTPQQPESDVQTAPQQGGLTAEEVEALVQGKLESNSQMAKAQSNVQQVSQALSGKFGDKAQEVVTSKAKELGTTVQELEKLSSQNPNMVLALFNTQQSSTPSATHGSINQPVTTPDQPELKRPERSLLAGATSAEQRDFYKEVTRRVYERFGVKE